MGKESPRGVCCQRKHRRKLQVCIRQQDLFLSIDALDFLMQIRMTSSREREISFVAHHGVHHIAMIRLMMAELNCDIQDETMGLANSTIIHLNQEGNDAANKQPS